MAQAPLGCAPQEVLLGYRNPGDTAAEHQLLIAQLCWAITAYGSPDAVSPRLTGGRVVDILLTFRSLIVVDESSVFSRSAASPAQGRASG